MKTVPEKKQGLHIGIQAKFILLFLALAIVLCVGVGSITYNVSYTRVVEQYSQIASSAARMGASIVDGDLVEHWLQNGEDDAYAATKTQLQSLKRNFNLKYLYASVPFGSGNNTKYIFDIAIEGEDASMISSLGQETGPVDVYSKVMQIYNTGQGVQTGIVTQSEFGYLISAYEPIFSTQNPSVVVGWVGVDIEMSVVLAAVRVQTLQILSVSIGIILLFVLLIVWVINRQVIHPVQLVSACMENFVQDQGKLANARLTTINTRDEIETMANSFNRMADNIVGYAKNIETVTADKERIATELSVATQIQSSMLPSTFPAFPGREDFDIFAMMDPAKEVGGDFYDFFFVDDDHLSITIADVSGKGVPAALFMVITRTLMKNHAALKKSPAEVFTAVNNLLCENNSASMFVTAFTGILNLKTGEFVYANAGHNPPLIKRKGGNFEWIKTKPALFLAGMEGMRYREYSMTLCKGDELLLYTDGVTEALDAGDDLYGEDRLLHCLNRLPEHNSASMLQLVKEDVQRFVGGAEQADDITMLAFRFLGSAEPQVQAPAQIICEEFVVAAKLDQMDGLLQQIEELLQTVDCPMKTTIAINIAVEELFVNIASYAYDTGTAGTAVIRCEVEDAPRRATITLSDSGKPFNPLLKKDPDVKAGLEDRSIGGLGIYIVKKSMDSVRYDYAGGRNIITIEKNF